MKKKMIIILSIMILVFFTILIAYSQDYDLTDNKTTLTVYVESSFTVEQITNEITTNSYYEGYDKDTVNWFSSLKGKTVFSGKDYFVVMDNKDAQKLPTECATDVSITDVFNCEIIEKHSLGNDLKDVIYVKNVEFLEQNIEYLQ